MNGKADLIEAGFHALFDVDIGYSIEDVIENICHKSFFADFIINSLKYYNASSLEKEAADLLVVFNETLLVFQIKSKFITGSTDPN